MEVESIAAVTINKVSATGAACTAEDFLAVEEPLEVQLAYYDSGIPTTKTISVTMRTPGDDGELAVGFLFTEGIIQKDDLIAQVKPLPFEENKILVLLEKTVKPVLQNTDRNFYTTSSCGVCGKASIDAIRTVSAFTGEEDSIRIPAQVFYGLQHALLKQQQVFESTGGLHASALFALDGQFILLREDVGRHNALDKVIGSAFRNGLLPLSHVILLLSGRASFELIQKAVMAGIHVVAAVGAPSSLAVQLAKENGITLIGFLRKERFNIYTGPERIKF